MTPTNLTESHPQTSRYDVFVPLLTSPSTMPAFPSANESLFYDSFALFVCLHPRRAFPTHISLSSCQCPIFLCDFWPNGPRTSAEDSMQLQQWFGPHPALLPWPIDWDTCPRMERLAPDYDGRHPRGCTFCEHTICSMGFEGLGYSSY
jgi:hypothetical protein